MAKPEKYKHIDFKPPNGVRREAEYGLKLRREHGRGGTAVGIARARDLSNGVEVSPSTVRRMKAFFDRHQSDEKADGFNRGDAGYPSNGKIANLLWGGPSGYSWAKKVVEQMEAADRKDSRSLRPFGSTHGMKPRVKVVHGAPGSGKSEYVWSSKGEDDVVFDFDRVMSALSGLPYRQSNKHLISYCTDIRTLILKKALYGHANVGTTWIITTRLGDDFSGMLSDIPVEYIEMPATKDECLKRVSESPEWQPVIEEIKQVIDEYFAEREEQRAVDVRPGVERRYLGNFSYTEKADPNLLRVERRADPETGKPRTYLVGYAAVFGKDSLMLGDFIERIHPDAFQIVKDRQDEDGKPLETRCLFNHSPDHLLGRFPTTMRMTVDDKGLRYECLLPESRGDLAELVQRGDLKGSSFSFVVSPDGGEEWKTENGQSIRIVKKIRALLDCGPVTYPAYGDASVSVAKRSYEAHVATARPVKRRDLSDVVERARGLRSFLAERRDCGRDEGGKFDNENKCQGGGTSEKSPALDRNKVAAQVASTGGAFRGWKSQSLDDGSVSVSGKAGQFTVSKASPPFGVKGKSNIHFNPDGGGKEVVQLALDAARATGSETVSVQSWSPEHDAALKENGFKKTGGAFTKSEDHDVWIKDLSKKSSRSERRDCGRDEGGRFGSGNKCQEDEAAATAEPVGAKKSPVLGKMLDRVAKEGTGGTPEGTKKPPSSAVLGKMLDRVAKEGAGGTPEGTKKPPSSAVLGKMLDRVAKEGTGGTPEGTKKSPYMEWKKGDDKKAQKFIDDAREGQLARGGKGGGKSDDGGGVQTWSKGDDFPWTTQQVGTDEGYLQAQHPDGSKTEKYPFSGGDTTSAIAGLRDELKRRKTDTRSLVATQIAETMRFLRERH